MRHYCVVIVKTMLISDLCSPSVDSSSRRTRFHQRKLEVMRLFRDSLERRLASVNASIETIENQINRDLKAE